MISLITAAIFVSIALLSGALLYHVLGSKEILKERVARLAQQEEEVRLVRTPTKWQIILATLGRKLRMNGGDLQTYRVMLTAAGFRKESVYIFLGAKLFLAAALPALYVTLVALPHHWMAERHNLLICIALSITGYLLPTVVLGRLAENRKTEIFHALPDVLDLLTVCVEAGLSLDAAFIKTVDNFIDQKNPLIREINTVTLEIRAGKPHFEALRGLAERTTLDDIKSLVSIMVQSERFGTSMGKTMRTFSESLRIRRRQLAEERAAKTGVKMLFPLTLFVFPALFVVMLTPAFFRIYTILSK